MGGIRRYGDGIDSVVAHGDYPHQLPDAEGYRVIQGRAHQFFEKHPDQGKAQYSEQRRDGGNL